MTMYLIQTITVGATAVSTIDFTSIPQDGTDLYITTSLANSNGAVEAARIRINGDTSSIYTNVALTGSGTAATSTTTTASTSASIGIMNGALTNAFSSGETYITNYANSLQKSALTNTIYENNASAGSLNLFSHLFNQTPAITSISIFPITSTFVQHSTVSLYKITKGSGGATVA